MKSLNNRVIILFLLIFIFLSCSKKETIDNIKTGITQQHEAVNKYSLYAGKAAEEGYSNISNMFEALALGKNINLRNHETLLEEYNRRFDSEVYSVDPGLTLRNLQSAIDDESFQITELYAQYLADSRKNSSAEVQKVFGYSLEAGEKYEKTLSNALDILLNKGYDFGIPSVWHVCPTCGNLFSTVNEDSACEICGEPVINFITVN